MAGASSLLTAKRRMKKVWWATRRPTARLRALPDFIVFGAQKAGTTSLYHYLVAHRQVRRPFGQEPTFFSHEIKWMRGQNEYQSVFPLRMTGLGGRRFITGEASGEYIYYPAAPDRIRAIVPEIKLIAVFREPVAGSVSHYFHNVKLGLENRSIEQAIDDEIAWQTTPSLYSEAAHRQFGEWGGPRCYIGRSLYAHHLKRWMEAFPDQRLLVLQAEQMYSEPRSTMEKVFEYLELEMGSYGVPGNSKFNQGSKLPVAPATIEQLDHRFKEANRELATLMDSGRRSLNPLSDAITWAI